MELILRATRVSIIIINMRNIVEKRSDALRISDV